MTFFNHFPNSFVFGLPSRDAVSVRRVVKEVVEKFFPHFAYNGNFFIGLSNDKDVLGYQKIVRNSFPPALPIHSREAIFCHINVYGRTGTGKTVLLCYLALEKYCLFKGKSEAQRAKARQFGFDGFKIFEIDILGKGELACAFQPLTDEHPLYQPLMEAQLEPESYPVQVLRPLVFIRGKAELMYRQPEIVRPFTLALSDISLTEWGALLAGGLSPGQSNLLSTALKELKNIEYASMYDLYVKCQEIIESGNVGFRTHIDQLNNAPGIPLTKAVFGGKEGKGLLQKLGALIDTGFIQPKRWKQNLSIPQELHKVLSEYDLKGKSDLVPTNLDLSTVLNDQETISVLMVPNYKDLPHLNFGIINYFLNHIYSLKNPNNPDRVNQPVCLVLPELRNFVPKKIPDNKRYFVGPVKATLLDINSGGAGMGICLVGDTQHWEQIDDEYRANVGTVCILDLGEEATEKIKDLVGNRYVSNKKQITDNYHLSALKDIGTFIYLGYGSTKAEIHKNAVVGFWYPRSRGAKGESETNFYNLFKYVYPERMVNIGSLYSLSVEIMHGHQTSASEDMHNILAEKKKREKKSKSEKKLLLQKEVLEAVYNVCESRNNSNFEYKDISNLVAAQMKKSVVQAQRHLKNLESQGLLMIDDSQGQKKKKVLVNRSQVKKALENVKEELET